SWSNEGPGVLRLLPGPHKLLARFAEVSMGFGVGPAGEVTIDQSVGYATVQGGTLRVTGYPVTVDATALSYASFAVSGASSWSNEGPGGLRLLPGPHKLLARFAEVSMGFGVGPAGEVTIDQSVGYATVQGGTLRVTGYPVTVDATALSYASFAVSGASSWSNEG